MRDDFGDRDTGIAADADARSVARGALFGLFVVLVGIGLCYACQAVVSLRSKRYCTCWECYDRFVEGPDADAFHGFPAEHLQVAGSMAIWIGMLFVLPYVWGRVMERFDRVFASLSLGKPDPGRCASCGYDLTGLPIGVVCPECGRKRAP